MSKTRNTKVTATVTLQDGTSLSLTWAKLPKYWKSHLLHQLPWGSDQGGAVFTAVRAA